MLFQESVLSSNPVPTSADVFSDACPSFSLTGLGSNLLLPLVGKLAHCPNSLVSGCKNLSLLGEFFPI